VVVVNLESTFNDDNLMVEKGTYINFKFKKTHLDIKWILIKYLRIVANQTRFRL